MSITWRVCIVYMYMYIFEAPHLHEFIFLQLICYYTIHYTRTQKDISWWSIHSSDSPLQRDTHMSLWVMQKDTLISMHKSVSQVSFSSCFFEFGVAHVMSFTIKIKYWTIIFYYFLLFESKKCNCNIIIHSDESVSLRSMSFSSWFVIEQTQKDISWWIHPYRTTASKNIEHTSLWVITALMQMQTHMVWS